MGKNFYMGEMSNYSGLFMDIGTLVVVLVLNLINVVGFLKGTLENVIVKGWECGSVDDRSSRK